MSDISATKMLLIPTILVFHEALKFAKFVMGLQCDLGTFETAWVAGIMRTASQTRPLRKQSKVLTVEALQFLERRLEDKQLPSVDRFAIGVILFATYSRARFGDLRGISGIVIDAVSAGTDESVGYLEMHSASHKMRATGNRLGAHLPLVAPLKGLGPHAWGKTFVELSQQVGLDFASWCQVQPLLPAPNLMGAWTDRPVTSGEIRRWICQLLLPCSFDTTGFTPHGCKATTLAMLSKYGVASETRLALGHHQIQKGAVEVYARDTQSAPLRILEAMFKDIRNGRFHPDHTRSGMFLPPAEQQEGPGHADEVTDLPLPSFSVDQNSPASMGDVAPVVAVDDETHHKRNRANLKSSYGHFTCQMRAMPLVTVTRRLTQMLTAVPRKCCVNKHPFKDQSKKMKANTSSISIERRRWCTRHHLLEPRFCVGDK